MLETVETGARFPERASCVSANLEHIDRGQSDHQPASFAVQTEHELRLHIGIRFVANELQYGSEYARAMKQLKHKLYGDMIDDLYEAINACHDRQTRIILDRIMDKINE